MTEQTNIFKGLRDTGLGALGLLVVNLLQIALLARLLHTADFAIAAYGAVVVNLCLHLQSAGINAVLVREKHWSRVQLSTFFWLNLLRGAGFLGIVVLAAFFAKVQIFCQVLALHGSALLVYGAGLQYKALLQKELQFKLIALAEMAAAVLALLFAVWMAAAGAGPLAIAGGYATRYGFEALFLGYAGRRYFSPAWQFSLSSVKPFLGFSILHVAERAAMFLVSQLDFLLLGWWWGNDIAGAYDAIKRILSRPVGIVAGIFDRINFPVWAALRGEPGRLGTSFRDNAEQTAFIIQPAYLFAGITAGPLLTIFLGPQWSAYAALFQYLCVAFMWQMLLHPVDTLLLAAGKIQWWLWAQLAFVPVLMAAIKLSNGAQGAVFGLVWAYGLFAIITYGVLAATYGFVPVASLWLPLALTLLMFITTLIKGNTYLPLSAAWTIVTGIIAGLACAMLFYRFSPAVRALSAYFVPRRTYSD